MLLDALTAWEGELYQRSLCALRHVNHMGKEAVTEVSLYS